MRDLYPNPPGPGARDEVGKDNYTLETSTVNLGVMKERNLGVMHFILLASEYLWCLR